MSNKLHFHSSRYKPKTKGVSVLFGNKPVRNVTHRLFGLKANFKTTRKPTQVLEFDDSHISCEGGGEKENNVYCVLEPDCAHNSVDGKEIEQNNAMEHAGEDYYDHSGQARIKKPETGNIYNAFRNTCNEYDSTAITFKPDNASDAYDHL